MPRTLYLIDGHAQIFRAYFAIRGGMNSPVTGEPTQAVFGFAGMLLKFFLQFQPEYAVMVIDSPGKTFRDDLYDQYKANRPPPPADFRAQEQRIFDLTKLFGIPILAQSGAEADDIIATLTRRVEADPRYGDVVIRIVSKDKDLEQLLSDRTTLLDIHTDTTVDPQKLRTKKGITPGQVIDVLALMGDSIDNVPGIEGIGPKTATELIHQFGDIDHLLANLDQLKGKRRENLEKGKDLLALSRKLVTLKTDLDLPFALEDARPKPIDAAGVRRMFEELGFRRHQADLDRLLGANFPGSSPASMGPKVSMPASPLLSDSPAPPKDHGFAANLFETVADSPPAAPNAPAPPSTLPDFSTRDYRAITTAEQLAELAATLRRQKIIAVDTETIGLGHRAELCGLSLSWRDNAAVYVPIRSPQPTEHLDLATVQKILGPIFADATLAKCGHNLKYDLLVLRHAGIELRGVVFDSMIASHLLGSPGHGLDHLALALLHHRMMQISDLIGHYSSDGGLLAKTMDQAPLPLITQYACDDAEVSLRLYQTMAPQLKLLGMGDLADRVEMPLVEVLADMEFTGVRVDPAVLQEQKTELAGRITILRDRIHELAGGPFNIDSPKQLADILFQKQGLPIIKKTKTGPSTDVEVLETLADREGLASAQVTLVNLLIEYRQLTKLVGTYLDSLRDSIASHTGRVHAQFHQTGAATGRLSSSDPNLQNIPIRSDVGKRIRRAFVAAPGNTLVCTDYSQIELRLLAHLSGDPNLIAAFEQGRDIHTAVAAQVFNVPIDQVTKPMRGYAKVINFGIVYGVTPYGLARRIEGMTVDSARRLIGDYKQRFAGIGAFLDKCVQQAGELGYVTTIMGRRRPIPQIKSTNPNQRSHSERLAINSVVQGSAADLIKLAMVNLSRRIRHENLPLQLLLQIHDELVLETPAANAGAMVEIVRHEMDHALTLRVPLKADVGTGVDWLTAKGE